MLNGRKMKRILCFFCFFSLTVLIPVRVRAAVQAELVAQKEMISEGNDFFLALKLTLPRGWHVYWKNPGDAGEAMDLKLDLPQGFQEIRRIWPAPKRFTVGTLTEYGYEREAWLFIQIRAPEKLKTGEVFTFSGRATWLGCHGECVPMAQDVAALAVAGSGGAENEEMSEQMDAFPEKVNDAVFYETAGFLILSVPAPADFADAYFFPEDLKTLTYSAPQKIKTAQGRVFLFLKKAAENEFVYPERLKGTLVFYNVQGETLNALDVAASKTIENLPAFEKPFVWHEFLMAVFFAFAGGILLNLMPCVFPVLSLKAFRLMNSGSSVDLKQRQKAGICYMAGVLLSFIGIGAVLIALRSAGLQMGWGFQLQYPPFVFGLCLLVFFLGLVFSDIVCIGEKISAFGMNLGRNWGDFGTGVLAVVVATPCAAPFMGSALGYGLMNSAPVTLSVFAAMGAGLAFPFVLLDFHPSLGRFLPKAGAWTMLFRNFLAFPLYGAAAWLLWILVAQEGEKALAVGLACLVAMAFCGWLTKAAVYSGFLKKIKAAVVVATVLLTGYGAYVLSPSHQQAQKFSDMDWMPYDMEKIREYRQAGVPVFIKFSAKWCLTCLVNEKAAFSSNRTANAFREKGVAAFAADWTNRSDEITAALESFGRGGIPLYVYYAPHAEQALILPQLITERIIADILKDL